MSSRNPDTAGILAAPAARPWHRRFGLLLLALAVLGGGAALLLRKNGNGGAPAFITTEAQRGELTVSVAASGNLQPINQVDVGSELSGTVETVLVDDNDVVKKGQVLARLDTRKLNDQIVKSRAALASAHAQVLLAEATRKEAETSLARLREVARLSGGKVPSAAELDSAAATAERAAAEVAVARAAVAQAQATLSTEETNLAKASIRAPIDGVVLARKVEPGQTVVASMNAPVLFTLAEDLTRMELQVKVDEADVGQVRPEQSATFTVDAYPNRKYPARITRVGLGSSTTDNVVSYLTVLTVDNADLSLRPGMTASAEILTQQRQDALLVPNTALRFTPPVAASAPKESVVSSLMPRPPRSAQPKRGSTTLTSGSERSLWVLRDGQPVELKVTIGASNGRQTEITAGQLQPGMAVITDTQGAAK